MDINLLKMWGCRLVNLFERTCLYEPFYVYLGFVFVICTITTGGAEGKPTERLYKGAQVKQWSGNGTSIRFLPLTLVIVFFHITHIIFKVSVLCLCFHSNQYMARSNATLTFDWTLDTFKSASQAPHSCTQTVARVRWEQWLWGYTD